MDSKCAVCHKKNEQLLMLSCGHDPCIDCAATHYFSGAQYRSEFELFRQANYWCQICYQPTIIDKSSIQQLNLYLSKKQKQANLMIQTLKRSKSQRLRNFSKHQRDKHSPIHIKHNSKQPRKTKQQKKQYQNIIQLASSHQMRNTKNSPKQMQYPQCINNLKNSIRGVKSSTQLMAASKSRFSPNSCNKHQDQYQLYYCFTCLSSICVECALHGSHVGHQVEAVKKASSRLKGIYENLISQSERCKGTLEISINQVDKFVQKFKAWNNKHCQLIKQKFNQLFTVLAQRQQKILNQIKQIEIEGINKIIINKRKQQQILADLKQSRKSLKKGINMQPALWNIQELQNTKSLLKTLIHNQNSQVINVKKFENQIKYVQTQLVIQAIDTIEQLVSTFKISIKNQSNQLKN